MKVLCVSPRFPPVNAADCHRLRLLLPHFAAEGWHAEVLTVLADDVSGAKDPWLAAQLPPGVPVHRVPAWHLRGWGLNGLAQRSLVPLYRKGAQLLARGGFDLVFFSTTEFLVHLLGPAWKRRFGVPFCMDLQDPWVTDYYREHPQVMPPGGRLKFGIMDRIDRVAERKVVRDCDGFVAVSEAYLHILERRYGSCIAARPRLVAPFPAEPAEQPAPSSAQRTSASEIVWRYVGRGGGDMHLAARAFFRAWQRRIGSGALAANAVRFEAIGTSYSNGGTPAIEALAREEGLAGQVTEQTARVGYRNMLELLHSSDALVVFGSDDAAYTASKIYPYLLAGKPLLVICHASSPMRELLASVGGATCVEFDSATDVDTLASRIDSAWFDEGVSPPLRPLDVKAFEPFTAASQAGKVTDWFNSILEVQS